MEDFFSYLGMMLNLVAWMLKNLDLCLGGLSLLALFADPGMDTASKIPLILMAVIGLGIRVVRGYLKWRNA